jgi:hypothetical protein
MKIKFNIDTNTISSIIEKPYDKSVTDKYYKDIKVWQLAPEDKKPDVPVLPPKDRISLIEAISIVIQNAIRLAYPNCNIQRMRQCINISNKLEAQFKSTTNVLELDENDVKFINSAMSKAEFANTSVDLNKFIIFVYETINKSLSSKKG